MMLSAKMYKQLSYSNHKHTLKYSYKQILKNSKRDVMYIFFLEVYRNIMLKCISCVTDDIIIWFNIHFGKF